MTRTHDALDGEAKRSGTHAASDGYRFQMLEQASPFEPGHVLAAGDDVVAHKSAHRDEIGFDCGEAGQDFSEVGFDAAKHRLVIIYEIHLVDGDH